MAFFMRSLKRGGSHCPVQAGLAWTGVALWLLVAAQASAGGFEVQHAQTRLVDNVYLLDADLDLKFSKEALKALKNGVTLTVKIEMEIIRPRDWLWDEEIADVEARRRVRFHPLSDQYLVENLNSGVTYTYHSLNEARNALGTIKDFPLIDSYLLDPEETYELHLRAHLDIEALPTPLRPLAYLNPVWHLTSEWYEWPIER
jgi:hypothetical protein